MLTREGKALGRGPTYELAEWGARMGNEVGDTDGAVGIELSGV